MTVEFTLVRVAVPADDAGFGVLLRGGLPFAVTLDRRVISVGIHRCVRTHFEKDNYDTYEILVEGHSRLLFHKGNYVHDTDGCILVAESYGVLKGETAIIDSQDGFAEFMRLTNGVPEFQLEVKEIT